MSSPITPQKIQDLRKRTGVGIGKCKQALEQVAGDIDQAVEYLRKAGFATATKKAERETKEGQILFKETKELIVFCEVNAETDFVVKNERFQDFHRNICDEIVATKPSSVEDFLQQPYSQNKGQAVDEYRKEVVAVLGENINVSRIVVVEKKENSSYGIYSHMGGAIVSLVVLDGSSDEADFAKSLAMHVAAEAPDYLAASDVPSSVIEKEKEIAKEQLKGKPENILEKILQGKVDAFCKQVCFLLQPFIKDSSQQVVKVVESHGKEKGKSLSISQFIRWQMGGS